MDLEAVNSESLHKDDLFLDPSNDNTLYQFRNKQGKSSFIREIGTDRITKISYRPKQTLLKVVGDLPKYMIMELTEQSAGLFNVDTGETFYLEPKEDKESIPLAKKAFDEGKEVNAEIFEYEEIQVLIRFDFERPGTKDKKPVEKTPAPEPVEEKSNSKELERVKAIEEAKKKKRPFGSTQKKGAPTKTTSKPVKTQPKSKQIKTPEKNEEKKNKSITTTKVVEKKEESSILIRDVAKEFKGLGAKTIELMEKNKISTLNDLLNVDTKALAKQLPRISEGKVKDWQNTAKKLK